MENKVILSIQNASYQYSDAAADEYAIKNISQGHIRKNGSEIPLPFLD